MYGYESPKRPDWSAERVMIRESEVARLERAHPALTRPEVMAVMVAAGPMRRDVEAGLAALEQRKQRGSSHR